MGWEEGVNASSSWGPLASKGKVELPKSNAP